MTAETQLPLFPPQVEWAPPPISTLPSWANARRVAVDVETRDDQLKTLGPGVRRADSYIVGVSFAIEDGPAFYLPCRHQGGGNLTPDEVFGYLKYQAARFKGDIVGANLPYDIDHLAEEGVNFKPRFFRDVQIAAPLVDELHESYSLEAIATREGIPGKDQKLLIEAAEAYRVNYKSELWKLPAKYVAPYGIQDVRLPLQILPRLERQIDEPDAQGHDLWQIYDLESRVLPVLVKMRRRGVRIDFDKLEQIKKWSVQQETEALNEVFRLTGVRVEVGQVWQAEAMAGPLKAIGVEPPLTKQTKAPSVTQELLDSIDHPVAGLLRRARKVNKLRTTFAESIYEHATNGRIHCSFNQLRRAKDDGSDDENGARYGRISSSDPNLQQQPGKKDPEFGLLWRQIYIPDEGAHWACCDFSQQEPRWAIHYAEAQQLVRAGEAANRYRTNPKTDSHQMMADLTGLPREQAKIIFLGLCYGMGGAKLCRRLGLPTEWVFSQKQQRNIEVAGPEGAAILDRFHREVPFMGKLTELCEEVAKTRGFIRTLLGRRCRFPKNEKGEYDWTYKAGNRLIQGTSADQTKMALVLADELDESVGDMKQAHDLAEIMIYAVQCNVPHSVGVESGCNWGQLSKEKAA
jgi:DNA polymerase I-like protein with 3'-5' exonuclease and polymerase domains